MSERQRARRSSRIPDDPFEGLELRLNRVEQELDERLHGHGPEVLARFVSRYVSAAERALAEGDLGQAQYYVERAKSLMGISSSGDDER